MECVTKMNEQITRIVIPYKDIYTTVFVVQTEEGVLLFDAAGSDWDIETYVLPYLNEIGIEADGVKFVFISHNHSDHAGGISAYLKAFPNICIITRNPGLKEAYQNKAVFMPEGSEVVLGDLKIISIPGHTKDSAGIYDMRTKTLITGDCLQLYGIFGSGKWAANISVPKEHFDAIDELKAMDIEELLMAHDYQPLGYRCVGKQAVSDALEACIKPLDEVKELILSHPECNDEEIAAIYNSPNRPTLGAHVVTALRSLMVG
ncbi:MAG: MBL fold metallo-hydrolase [Clostridia bacterium]|nr:MBL fold metallo-hydrolase [Clostridia bacterium]